MAQDEWVAGKGGLGMARVLRADVLGAGSTATLFRKSLTPLLMLPPMATKIFSNTFFMLLTLLQE